MRCFHVWIQLQIWIFQEAKIVIEKRSVLTKCSKRWNIPIIVMIPKDGISDHRALNHIPYNYFTFLGWNIEACKCWIEFIYFETNISFKAHQTMLLFFWPNSQGRQRLRPLIQLPSLMWKKNPVAEKYDFFWQLKHRDSTKWSPQLWAIFTNLMSFKPTVYDKHSLVLLFLVTS